MEEKDSISEENYNNLSLFDRMLNNSNFINYHNIISEIKEKKKTHKRFHLGF